MFPWLNVFGNVTFGLRRVAGLGAAKRRRIADYHLHLVGLAKFKKAYVHELSGGMKQRAALARCLAPDPRVLLMDEPFASLDAIVRARVVQDVAALVERERISVLLVTHDLDEAISLSDYVYLLSQGPRARITHDYPVPIPRPRDPVRARTHPAFAPLYEKLWTDLSHEVDRPQSAGAAP